MRKNTFPVIQYNLLILLINIFYQLPFKPTKMPRVSIFQICNQGGWRCPLALLPLLSVPPNSLYTVPWLTIHRTQTGNCFSRSGDVVCFQSPIFSHLMTLTGQVTEMCQAADTPEWSGRSSWTPGFPFTQGPASCPSREEPVTGLQGQLRGRAWCCSGLSTPLLKGNVPKD